MTKPILIVITILLVSCQQKGNIHNIKDYGAIGDSLTLNTQSIQRAIDQCNADGGGTVIIPAGAFISGTVLLKDNVSLHLEKGAQLIGSKNPDDYITIDPFVDAVGQQRGKCLIGADKADNISISGEGIINGRGGLFQHGALRKTMQELGLDEKNLKNFASNRPFLIRLVASKNIKIQKVQLKDPAAWTLHLFQCQKIRIDGIDIYSHAHHNNDGIDLDSSRDAAITNCNIDSGDDAICIKSTSPAPARDIYVSSCRLKSDWGTIKLGTESMGDFKNILIENCEIYDTRGGGIKILSMDGANIDSVTIRDIKMENVEMPLFVRLGERLNSYRDAPKQRVGSMKNIRVENIHATVRDTADCRINPPTGILITGTPNHPIETITLKNINITLPGFGTAQMLNNVIAEDEARYPEFSFFGVLPAYGMYARHIAQLHTDGVTFSLEANDERKEEILVDVTKL